MAFWTPFFPSGLKWKSLLRCLVMISLRTFSPEIKSISSSFMKSFYIINIFYHFIIFEPRIFEVWKGKNLCPSGVNGPYDKKQNGLALCGVWLFWSSILSRWEWVMINHGFTKNRLKYTNGPKNYMGGSEIFWTLFFFFQIREILILAQAILKMNLFIRFGLLRNL